MKKSISFLLIMLLMLLTTGCNLEQSPSKLVELEKYSSMTIDGTISIEVVYDYIKGEETTYEFVIYDEETIEEIMTEIFNMELKDYPEDQDISFYQRWITVNQGNNEFYISLAYTSDENDNRYLCQSRAVCEIIEKYIEDNLITNDIVAKETTIKGIDGATKIEASKYDMGEEIGSVTVTEEASIKHIVDNLSSLKLKELKYNMPTSIEYELTFYNADGEIMRVISITLDGWVDYGSLHSVVSGELDRAYIDGLFTVLDEDKNQDDFNDIFYAAAYPQDFEYNGRHYHQVQGDELKASVTKEELGGLLGYIIGEEDVSAFTQEYPNIDYVIDNGIYDYKTNNRVAFYSIKAYPDLNFICMNQLGEYVLFQDEQNCQTN